MMRRAVAAAASAEKGSGAPNSSSSGKLPTLATTSSSMTSSSRRKKASGGGSYKISSDAVVLILVGAAALFTIAAYYNTPVQQPRIMQRAEQAASAEIASLWNEFHDVHGNKPPLDAGQHPDMATSANANNNLFFQNAPKSQVTGASWVQGEQLLKAELTKLAARQAQGLDIGVPVLTRWLGPDVPAWPSTENGISEGDWKAIVEQKYAAMREEETAWRQQMGQYLASPAAASRG